MDFRLEVEKSQGTTTSLDVTIEDSSAPRIISKPPEQGTNNLNTEGAIEHLDWVKNHLLKYPKGNLIISDRVIFTSDRKIAMDGVEYSLDDIQRMKEKIESLEKVKDKVETLEQKIDLLSKQLNS